jgi:hypothetical protein
MSNIGGKISVSKRKQRNPHYLQSQPPGNPSGMLLRNNTTLSEVMTTCIPNGPHCGKKETKQCQISQISSIPCAPRWVSNIRSDIWCSSIAVLCIDTSRPKWNFWTSHPWARPTDMSSKSSRSSNKRRAAIWAWEPLTTKARKGWPQPTEQSIEKRWTVSGQPVQAASKEGHQKDKERYRKWYDFHKSPWHNTVTVAQSSRWWPK